jgi:5-methylthioribose kinase
LKIAYPTPTENFSGTIFQEELEKSIMLGSTKNDFSSFDIYQFIDDTKKSVWVKKGVNESEAGRLIDFKQILEKAEKQIMFFSGNLSFINFKDKTANIYETIEGLVARGISIKVVCRVDFAGYENIRKILSLNYKYNSNLIEIKHKEQPLRATIVDNKIINLKDSREPTGRKNELKSKLFIFYTIYDKEWIKWLTRIFWNMFNKSISAEKRLKELEKIKV